MTLLYENRKYILPLLAVTAGILCIYIFAYPYWQIHPLRPVIDIFLKAGMEILLIMIAIRGLKINPSKRNRMLMLALVLYAIGDIFTDIEFMIAGTIYFIGHMLIVRNIFKTTHVVRKQKITALILWASFSFMLGLYHFGFNGALGLYFLPVIGYSCILTALFSYCTNFKPFLIASIFFVLSDCVGFLWKMTPFLDTAIPNIICYITGVSIFALSTYAVDQVDAGGVVA